MALHSVLPHIRNRPRGLAGAAHTLIADLFGAKRFATLRGFANAFQIPVSVVVPLFMGYAFDTRGTYEVALLAIAALVVCGALSLALIRRKTLF